MKEIPSTTEQRTNAAVKIDNMLGIRYRFTPETALATLDHLLSHPKRTPWYDIVGVAKSVPLWFVTAYWAIKASKYLWAEEKKGLKGFSISWNPNAKRPDDALRFSKMICEVFSIMDAETVPMRMVDEVF